ncbi:DNA-binding protein [Hydrogenoanaerobacterium sp.]|uniref:PPC domain-containing DNA-binding protein n=1 Tax=Hydrogenoanaerobacterium sp. TaxID=2953763 RepID=UPI0028984B80|nr:DNA-binding protein [Hydrogenoanaerobacterium sp.]
MDKVYKIIIDKDEHIKTKIQEYVLSKGWESAYISGAIGSVKELVLTAPENNELPPKVGKVICRGPGEVLAFTGEIMPMNKIDSSLKAVYHDTSSPLFIHIHASVAVAGGHVYGGGFHEGCAFRSLKVYIQPID